MTPILGLDNVSFAYRGAEAGQHAVRGHLVQHRTWTEHRPGRRVRLWQDDAGQTAARSPETDHGPRPLRWGPARPGRSQARSVRSAAACRPSSRTPTRPWTRGSASVASWASRCGRCASRRGVRQMRSSRTRSNRSDCPPMPLPATHTSSRAGNASASPSPGPSSADLASSWPMSRSAPSMSSPAAR